MASTYLQRTVGTPTNAQKYTYSFWIKRCELTDGSKEAFLLDGYADASNRAKIAFNSNNLFEIWNSNAGSFTFQLSPPRKIRDTNAWYHIVLSVDTTQSTASDRVKLYINGVQETNLGSTTYPPQNDANNTINESGTTFSIMAYGGIPSSDSFRLSSIMSHVHFTDGTAYDASTFGETDATTGIWKPKTEPSVTYGNNGFFLKFENSGSMGTDSSGNANNFTVNGNLTQTVDTPSNVYATWNPLIPQGLAYANGNLSATHNAASWKSAYGTLSMSGTGKYYFESKVSTLGSYQGVGIVDAEQISSSASKFGAVSRGYGYKNDGNKTNNDVDVSYGATYTTGDIIMCAVDLNAGAIWWGKNGTWQNSATQSEIENGTTTNAGYTGISNSYVYLPAVQIYGSGTNQLNTGNGYFGTTAVASAGSNGNGAIFEYDVPSGFYALNTKNLNTYG